MSGSSYVATGLLALKGLVYSKLTVKTPAIHFRKDKNGNTRTMCEIYSKLTMKTAEWCLLRCVRGK